MSEDATAGHVRNGTGQPVAILKSPPYGPVQAATGHLPYRIDLLADHGFELRWTDVAPPQRGRRWWGLLERVGVPVRQAWSARRQRTGAVAVLAMFESEGHGLALARRLGRRRQPPLVIVACWLTDLAATSSRRRWTYRWLYRSVDAVVVFSSNQVPLLAELVGLDPARVHVVRFGIDRDELPSMGAGRSGAAADVVAVGRDLGRDWQTLAKAAAGTDWHVDLVTRPQQLVGVDLPPQVEARGLVERGTYLDLLARATVVVVPTHVLHYPTGQSVLLEAMAMGCACVVTATPAMADYVVDRETALLVPPGDPKALRRAVDELRHDADLRARLGQQAASVEAAAGGAGAMWAAVAGVIDQVSDRPASPPR